MNVLALQLVGTVVAKATKPLPNLIVFEAKVHKRASGTQSCRRREVKYEWELLGLALSHGY